VGRVGRSVGRVGRSAGRVGRLASEHIYSGANTKKDPTAQKAGRAAAVIRHPTHYGPCSVRGGGSESLVKRWLI
jgi:hypothetical protein